MPNIRTIGYLMRPRSNSLFHFTNHEKFLFDILESGFWPRYCLEDIIWQDFKKFEFIAFPMVCFCDVPLSRITEHTEHYGSYGVGLKKEWAERNTLNPVLYISPKSGLRESILRSMDFAARTCSDIEKSDSNKELDENRFLVSHIKPTKGIMLKNENKMYRDFYQESEWRYIPRNPSVATHLVHSEFNDAVKIDFHNRQSKKYCSLKITPIDIAYIFVPTDSDIPKIIKFIQNNLRSFSQNDLMILYSRIVSIETLQGDM
jgi:hypothetical protein